jgi:hypothetical protein
MEFYILWCWVGSLWMGPLLALAKGRGVLEGFSYGVLFGPFGVIVLGLMPSRDEPRSHIGRFPSVRRISIPERPARGSESIRKSADPGPDEDLDVNALLGR